MLIRFLAHLSLLLAFSVLVSWTAGCGGDGSEEQIIVRVVVSPSSASIAVAETVVFTGAAQDSDGKTIPSVPLAWNSSVPTVAKVDAAGVVTGISPGTAKISASIAGLSGAATVTVTPVNRRFDLTVSVAGDGSVSSNPPGIDCPAACSSSYGAGTQVTLSATPAADFVFAGWSGACTGTGTCALPMDENKSVTATFQPVEKVYTLNVTKIQSGRVTSLPAGIDCGANCSASFAAGTQVTLTATPAADFVFVGWSGDCSGSDTCLLNIAGNRSVTATFDRLESEYSIAVTTVEDGKVTSTPAGIDCGSVCSAFFAKGSFVTLSAVPAADHEFIGWDGPCSGLGDCTLTIDRNKSVTATFAPIQYWVSVSKKGNGAVTSTPAGIACGMTCSVPFNAATGVVLAAKPDPGWRFVGWSGDCAGMGTCTLTMDRSKWVTAAFESE